MISIMSISPGGHGWSSSVVVLRTFNKIGSVDLTNPLHSVMSQVFVVVAAGSVLSFIIRELGQPAIASWIIQVRSL